MAGSNYEPFRRVTVQGLIAWQPAVNIERAGRQIQYAAVKIISKTATHALLLYAVALQVVQKIL